MTNGIEQGAASVLKVAKRLVQRMSSKQKRTLGLHLGCIPCLGGLAYQPLVSCLLGVGFAYFLSMGCWWRGPLGSSAIAACFDIVVSSGRRVLALIANKPPEEAENQQTFAQYVQRERGEV